MPKITKEWIENNREMVKRKNDKYNESVDRITFLVPKGRKDDIKHCAEKSGKSTSEFCADLVLAAVDAEINHETE